MKKYKDALETMCRRCANYEMCQGTGCGPKKALTELIADKLLSALGHELGESRAAYMEQLMQEEGDQE